MMDGQITMLEVETGKREALRADMDQVIRRFDHCRNTGDCDSCELHDLPYKRCRWEMLTDAVKTLREAREQV